ncbi:MAG: low temperature requirement protein A [Actinobacteria bacterium]|nr:MAG: low temperature requirement protein A [Actinomycetota bacterium]
MKLAAIRPPRLQTVDEGDRNATWLELFYDLAFVATVAMLGTRLVADTSLQGWLSYSAYFVLVWWLWASHTFYADRYDTDDLVYRLLAGGQMVALAILAASVSTGPSGSTVAFAAAYAGARVLLLLLYARAYRFVPATRQLVRGYLTGFGIGAVLWIVSVFVPEPLRFWLWGIALAIDLATPFVVRKAQAAAPLDVSHLPERFGLFTILVLGETIVAVTVGLSHVEWQLNTTIAGVAGLAIATGIWWIHFDNVDGRVVRRKGGGKAWQPTVWIYSHLPLAIGIAMIGVGVEHAIVASDSHHDYGSPERWLLVGGLVVALAAMVGIEVASKRDIRDDLRTTLIISRLAVIALAILVGLVGGLEAPATVVVLAALCGALVLTDLVIATLAGD